MSDLQENSLGFHVFTPHGYKLFKGIVKHSNCRLFKVYFDNGNWLECTAQHRLVNVNGRAIDVLSVTPEDYFFTDTGTCSIASIESTNKFEDVYDLVDVDDGHWYYTNGVLSHNCDFNAAFAGSYWGKSIQTLRDNGRIVTNLYRPDITVSTSWDLGIADEMSVWFHQLVGDDINVIDFEEHNSWGFPEWKRLLDNRTNTLGYKYDRHYAPQDIQVRELTTGVSRLETAAKQGIKFSKVPPHKVEDGIQLVRQNLPRCRFDESRCKEGIEHLMMYQSRMDRLGEDVGPLHDKHSHAADSFRYLIAGVEEFKGIKPKLIDFNHMAR